MLIRFRHTALPLVGQFKIRIARKTQDGTGDFCRQFLDLDRVRDVPFARGTRILLQDVRHDSLGPIRQSTPTRTVVHTVDVENAHRSVSNLAAGPMGKAVSCPHRNARRSPRAFPLHAGQAIARPDSAHLLPRPSDPPQNGVHHGRVCVVLRLEAFRRHDRTYIIERYAHDGRDCTGAAICAPFIT